MKTGSDKAAAAEEPKTAAEQTSVAAGETGQSSAAGLPEVAGAAAADCRTGTDPIGSDHSGLT